MNMAHVLELPEDVYERLQRVAEKEGVTPVEWIEATISRHASSTESEILAGALAPFIGTVDSSTTKPDPRYRSDFGDLVDRKFAKQGFKPPQWEQCKRVTNPGCQVRAADQRLGVSSA